ncbi:MAG TPA: radical SAM protein, partial [Candidatus Faecivivens stercorigallinarum]|nr:radical SAM protein [Candidatus Faecivivens stercorigallinarum]
MLSLLEDCRLCPRACGVNRRAGEKGFCGASGETVRFARAAL